MPVPPGSPTRAAAAYAPAYATNFPGGALDPSYANNFPGGGLDAERRYSPPKLYQSQQIMPYVYAPEDFATGADVVFTNPSEMPHPAYGTCSLRGKRATNEDRLFCFTKLDPA